MYHLGIKKIKQRLDQQQFLPSTYGYNFGPKNVIYFRKKPS